MQPGFFVKKCSITITFELLENNQKIAFRPKMCTIGSDCIFPFEDPKKGS